MIRRVFYSFHYKPDSWRAAEVRNIRRITGNEPASDNDWETVTRGGDAAIKRWIAGQMYQRTCTVVLVGSETADRKWINHEIIKSWENNMGIVGIRIHELKDRHGKTSSPGKNPFDYISFENSGKKLSLIVKCHNPEGNNSQERYAWISEHLENVVEEAIRIRNKH